MEHRYPLYFAAAGIASDRIENVRGKKAKLKAVVLQGGPIYLLAGRVDSTAEAERQILAGNFIMGSSVASDAEFAVNSDVGVVTVYNRNAGETVCYLQLTGEDC